MSPQNVTTEQPSAIVLPQSDIRFDQELVGWFALRGSVWSGTAGELLAAVKTRVDVCSDLWPHSSRALYAHIESHMQILRSLGVEACLRHGSPRMISLRGCQVETTARKPPSVTPAFNRITRDLPISLVPLPYDQKISNAHWSPKPSVETSLKLRLNHGTRSRMANVPAKKTSKVVFSKTREKRWLPS